MTTTAAVRERPMLMSGAMVRATLDGRKRVTRRVVKLDRLWIRARHRVTADWAGLLDPNGELICEAGKRYRAVLNPLGAVSAVMANGKHLGLKPGEFDFVCPYADGETVLTLDVPDKQTWRIIPRESALYFRESLDVCSTGLEYSADGTAIEMDDRAWDLWNQHAHEDGPDVHPTTIPSILVPGWASRIRPRVRDVRLERLQEIDALDAECEGLKTISKDGGITWKYGIPDRDGWPGTDDDGWPWHEWDVDARRAFLKLWDQINAERGYPASSNPWVWVVSFERTEAPR